MALTRFHDLSLGLNSSWFSFCSSVRAPRVMLESRRFPEFTPFSGIRGINCFSIFRPLEKRFACCCASDTFSLSSSRRRSSLSESSSLPPAGVRPDNPLRRGLVVLLLTEAMPSESSPSCCWFCSLCPCCKEGPNSGATKAGRGTADSRESLAERSSGFLS